MGLAVLVPRDGLHDATCLLLRLVDLGLHARELPLQGRDLIAELVLAVLKNSWSIEMSRKRNSTGTYLVQALLSIPLVKLELDQ